nr:hypothetical protein [Acinetobacter lwoffii]
MVVEEKQAVVLEQPKDQKVYLDIQHSTDLVAVGSIIISLLAFVVTIFIVCLTTKAQMKSNLSLIKSQKQRLDEELIFKNKQLITQNIIQYASKFISGQTNLIIKIRDFGVFYGYADQKDKLDRASHVGQLYQELRDISNQVLQDYHVLELFLLSKGRAIPNLEVKNRLFFNFLWRYLELLLDQVGSETMLKNQDTTIVEVLEHSEFKNIGLELKKALGEDNLTIYLILNELNRQMSKMIKTEIKKAA